MGVQDACFRVLGILFFIPFSDKMSVQAALRDASVGRTTISIAHRLSTLKDMDVIFVMDGGVVIEQVELFQSVLYIHYKHRLRGFAISCSIYLIIFRSGNHEKLLSMNGTYAVIAQQQNISVRPSSDENMK